MSQTVPISLISPLIRVGSIILISEIVVLISAIIYRWYTRNRIQLGLAILLALATVVLYLNVMTALGEVVKGQESHLSTQIVFMNLIVLATSATIAPLALRIGDRIAIAILAVSGVRILEGTVGSFAKTVGGVTTVQLPDKIEDLDNYDPVPQDIKDKLVGKSLVFPRSVSVDELKERLVTRLKEEYDIGFVDVEISSAGEITYLGVGQRLAGLGHTLSPGMAAVAIKGDPPNSASSGDRVQLWTTGENPQRVTTAEIRATQDDVVTIVLDETEAKSLTQDTYNLVTLPTDTQPEREFVSILRASEETMQIHTVEENSKLIGQTIGDIPISVIAVSREEEFVPIPPRKYSISKNDTLYIVASAEEFRRAIGSQ
ncbi:MAG: cation:proton antiporter regulatory subunit [Halobacteriaceae archaeon]